MSLYIGNKSNGDNIFHITNQYTTESDIRDNVLPSTVFHSSLGYLTYEKFEFTKYADNVFKVGQDFIDSWNAGLQNPTPSYQQVFPYIFIVNDTIVTSLQQLEAGNSEDGYWNIFNDSTTPAGLYKSQLIFYHTTLDKTYSSTFGYNFLYSTSPSATYNNIWVYPNAYSFSPQTMYAIKINFNTFTKTINSNPGYDKNLPINITNNSINVNGVNLASFKYVSKGKINNIDKYASDSLGNILQFINTSYNSGSVLFDTVTGDIYTGNKKIFSGTYKNAFLYNTYNTISYPYSNPYTLQIYDWAPSYSEWNTGLYFGSSEFIILSNLQSITGGYQSILRFSYFLQKGGDEALLRGSQTVYLEKKYQEGFILKPDGYLYMFMRSAGNNGYGNDSFTWEKKDILCLSFK